MALIGKSAHSFPNPVPAGTYVPQWSLLDVSVRYYLQYIRHKLMAHTSLRIVGTLTNRTPLVVRIIHSAFSWTAPNLHFVDSPEIPPGVLIGSSTTSSSSSTTSSSPSTTTASPTRSASPTPAPSPTSTGKSSHTGPFVGGVFAGIAVIGAVVLGIVHLRRRRPTPAYAAPSEGAPSSPFHGEPQPQKGYMGQSLADDGTHTSSLPPATRMSPMRLYVRAFVPSLRSVRASCEHLPILPEPERPDDVSKCPGSVLYHDRLSHCNLWIATGRRKHVSHHAGHTATRISWPTSCLITPFRIGLLTRGGVRVCRIDSLFLFT